MINSEEDGAMIKSDGSNESVGGGERESFCAARNGK